MSRNNYVIEALNSWRARNHDNKVLKTEPDLHQRYRPFWRFRRANVVALEKFVPLIPSKPYSFIYDDTRFGVSQHLKIE